MGKIQIIRERSSVPKHLLILIFAVGLVFFVAGLAMRLEPRLYFRVLFFIVGLFFGTIAVGSLITGEFAFYSGRNMYEGGLIHHHYYSKTQNSLAFWTVMLVSFVLSLLLFYASIAI